MASESTQESRPSLLIVSSGNAVGVALLAALVRHITADGPAGGDILGLCDFRLSMPFNFWTGTVPRLIGQEPLPAYRFHRAPDGRVHVELQKNPLSARRLILLRMDVDSTNLEGSMAGLRGLADCFPDLALWEDADCGFLRRGLTLPSGVQAMMASGPCSRLPSTWGLPGPVEDLLTLASATLYEPGSERLLEEALALHLAVRTTPDLSPLLQGLVRDGPASVPRSSRFLADLEPESVREEDFALLRLTEEQLGSLPGSPEGWLEHALQASLRQSDVAWALGFFHRGEGPERRYWAVLGANCHRPRGQTLPERLGGDPTGFGFADLQALRSHYAKVGNAEAARFGRMLTALLPRLAPELARRARTRIPQEPWGSCSGRAAALLFGAQATAAPDESDWNLPDTHAVRGLPSADHPAAVACAALRAQTPKAHRLRLYQKGRRELNLVTPWHNLQKTPEAETGFRKSFQALWRQAQMPWTSDDFKHARFTDEMKQLSRLEALCASRAGSGFPLEEFTALLKATWQDEAGLPGPGHQGFFRPACWLDAGLVPWWKAQAPPGWALGGAWDEVEQEAVMWGSEFWERVLLPLLGNVKTHLWGQPLGFLRLRLEAVDRVVRLSLLTSGPGPSREQLELSVCGPGPRQGLRQVIETVTSYGGSVTLRCRDGSLRWDSPSSPPRPLDEGVRMRLWSPFPARINPPGAEMVSDRNRADLVLGEATVAVSLDGSPPVLKGDDPDIGRLLARAAGLETVLELPEAP
ncbi:MAG TPA: hypothetical protein VNO81_12525 [Candidatus Nitrosotenuis sp.]|nr:hypothetical protein [Candidatus Nitrosotenuis sp.]